MGSQKCSRSFPIITRYSTTVQASFEVLLLFFSPKCSKHATCKCRSDGDSELLLPAQFLWQLNAHDTISTFLTATRYHFSSLHNSSLSSEAFIYAQFRQLSSKAAATGFSVPMPINQSISFHNRRARTESRRGRRRAAARRRLAPSPP